MAQSESAMFSEQLRAAIDASELSRYRICKEIELDAAVMSRFMSSQSGLAVDTIDRLCALLGLRLVKVEPKQRSAKR
jgi:ribosome-binding protein aMBF1 (putative translation factor)